MHFASSRITARIGMTGSFQCLLSCLFSMQANYWVLSESVLWWFSKGLPLASSRQIVMMLHLKKQSWFAGKFQISFQSPISFKSEISKAALNGKSTVCGRLSCRDIIDAAFAPHSLVLQRISSFSQFPGFCRCRAGAALKFQPLRFAWNLAGRLQMGWRKKRQIFSQIGPLELKLGICPCF